MARLTESDLDFTPQHLHMGSVHATVDLLRKATDACDKEICELEELSVLKTSLVDHSNFIQKQISFYDEDCDLESYQADSIDGCSSSGNTAELRALTKYIEELRELQSIVEDRLGVLEDRLSSAN